LTGSQLVSAKLDAAFLIGTNLVKANLRLANLNGVSLSEANLFGTIMPDGSVHNH
jgi:uncharacterized protein YjbI with pentapeptide repeats